MFIITKKKRKLTCSFFSYLLYEYDWTVHVFNICVNIFLSAYLTLNKTSTARLMYRGSVFIPQKNVTCIFLSNFYIIILYLFSA